MRDLPDRRIVGVAIALSVLVHIGLVVLFYSGLLSFQAPTQPTAIDLDLTNIDAKPIEALAKNQPAGVNLDRLPPSGVKPKKTGSVEFIDRLPPMPAVGAGVGEPANNDAGAPTTGSARNDPLNRSVGQMFARAGMSAPSGGNGGEAGVNRYSPNVADPGEAISISVKEVRYLGYFSHMRDKICLAWAFPSESLLGGQAGVVRLHFTVQRNGEVRDATISQSSGRRLLDESAVKAVREASFNPIRAEWPDKELRIDAAFRYSVSGFSFGDVPGLPRPRDVGVRGQQYLSLALNGGPAHEQLCD